LKRLLGAERIEMTDNELTIEARNIARCLTYNDDLAQAKAKHMLLEMAHRLDALDVRAHQKRDGLLLVNGIGKSRYATTKERLMHWLFGWLPREV